MLNRSEVRHRAENRKIVESRIGRYIRGEISATCLVNCPWRKTYRRSHKNSAVDYVMHRPRQQTTVEKIKIKVRPPFRNTINVKNTSFVSMVDDLKRLRLDDSKSLSRSGVNPSKMPKQGAKEEKPHHLANLHRKLEALAIANERVSEAFKRAPMEVRKSLQTNFADKMYSTGGRSSSKVARSGKSSRIDDSNVVVHDNNEFVSPASEQCCCLTDPDIDSFCMCQDDVLKRIIPEPGGYLRELKKKLNRVRNRSSANKSVVSPVLSFYSSHTEEPENFEYWQCN